MEERNPGISTINTDVVSSKLKDTQVRKIINARTFTGNDGKDGTLRNIKGTSQILYGQNFSENAKVIGTANDKDNDRLIFFVADPDGNDAILAKLIDDEIVKVAVEIEGILSLNFQIDKPITAFVIDGLLYWNDAHNPPRKINIEKGINRYIIGKDPSYPSIDDETISLIKKPPTNVIEPFYRTDTENRINKLRGKLFQFKYQWVYDDNEESVASPVSRLVLPQGKNDYNGEIIGNEAINNVIELSLNTGHHTVSKIKIYYREGNNGLWNLEKSISKEKLGLGNNVEYIYEFRNNNATQVVDQEKINLPYHAIPFKSDALGFIHTNNIVLAGNTEGFDNINTDVELDYSMEVISDVSPEVFDKRFTGSPGNINQGDPNGQAIYGNFITNIKRPYNLQDTGDIVRIQINGTTVEFVVDNNEANNPDDYADTIVSIINSQFGNMYIAGHGVNFNWSMAPGQEHEFDIFITGYTPYYEPVSFFSEIRTYYSSEALFNSVSSWKTGARQIFGINYYDGYGRRSFVQKAAEIYIPLPTEEGQNTVTPIEEEKRVQNLRYFVNWQINHFAPSWAKKYQWVRQISPDIVYFRRYIIDGVTHGSDSQEDTVDSDKSAIDITSLNRHSDITLGADVVNPGERDYAFPNSSIDAYVYQKGDRIRFLTKDNSYSVGSGNTGLNELLDKYIDLEILGYEVEYDAETGDPSATNRLLVKNFQGTPGEENIGEFTLAEIYRPKNIQEDSIYYEMSDSYDITESVDPEGNKIYLHNGNLQGQSFRNPAKGVFENGDVYMVPTVFSKNLGPTPEQEILSYIESESASNFYELKDYDIGRPNIENVDAEQKKWLSIRTSEKYFENTSINGLSDFRGDSDIMLSNEFGSTIYNLVETGFTLKAFQAKKITSFYIGRAGLQLATGEQQDQLLADSSADINTKSPAQELYGTIHKESVILVDRNIYFVDINRGAIVRVAANGMFDISDYGVKSEIYDICNKLKSDYDSNRIISHYNPITNEIGFSFYGTYKNGDTDNLGTYMFKENANGWTSVWYFQNKDGMVPELFANMNQEYYSFIKSKLYKHEVSEKMNFIYDNVLPMSVEIEFNSEQGQLKQYSTLEYIGQGNWAAISPGDISIKEEYSVTGLLQESLLPAAKFKNVKSRKVANFLKDINYKNSASLTHALINGDSLKGKVIKIKLTNNSDTESYIDKIIIGYKVISPI